MRVIQINKFNYLLGGADKYFLELSNKLLAAGYEVAKFCMNDPRNLDDPWSKYWPSRINFETPSLWDRLRAPGRIIYSQAAKRRLTAMIKVFKPDIIHVHNIYHQLSPSILDAARLAQVPVIMTLHDYKLICPNYSLLNHGKICEKCLDGHFWHCFKERCFKDSLGQSFLASIETSYHQWRHTYERGVKLFIAPSYFMADKCKQAGWPDDKLRVVINPVSFLPPVKREPQDYFLYFGRLSKEKGVDILLRAIAQTDYSLKIAGSGPEEHHCRSLAQELGLNHRVEFLGQKTPEEISQLLTGAIAAVIPSIWYENMPLSLLEALSQGCPVVASKIGGLSEIIEPGYNGWLCQPGEGSSLVQALNLAWQPDLAIMSQQAQESVKKYNWDCHLRAIENIYHEVIEGGV